MKFGICNELFEDWNFPDICQTVKSLGYDGLEIAPFTLASRITDVSAAERAELKKIMAETGLECIGLHWLLAKTEGFYLTTPDQQIRQKTLDYLKQLAQCTHDLGGSIMVFGSPKQRDLLPGVSADQALVYAEQVFAELVPTLAETGVTLCLEPLAPSETNFLNTIDQANLLIDRINHPNFRLHLDAKAQSSEVSTSVPELWLKHGSKSRHAHAQDTNLKGPGMGHVAFGPIVQSLLNSGYPGYLSVEVFDFTPGAVETARISLETLKQALLHD
ncbi:MAG: sugar phosphate isomerase/epimerase family protein [Planctomycetota bacterium]